MESQKTKEIDNKPPSEYLVKPDRYTPWTVYEHLEEDFGIGLPGTSKTVKSS
jgi:hypothetical protein